MDAVKSTTLHAARRHVEEADKVSIGAGKPADFVILSRNPLTTGPDRITASDVIGTVKEGRTVYAKEAEDTA